MLRSWDKEKKLGKRGLENYISHCDSSQKYIDPIIRAPMNEAAIINAITNLSSSTLSPFRGDGSKNSAMKVESTVDNPKRNSPRKLKATLFFRYLFAWLKNR